MKKREQNFLKIFEEKADELDLEELKYSELLKSSTKKVKDAEEIQRVNSQNCSRNII